MILRLSLQQMTLQFWMTAISILTNEQLVNNDKCHGAAWCLYTCVFP